MCVHVNNYVRTCVQECEYMVVFVVSKFNVCAIISYAMSPVPCTSYSTYM